MPVEQCLVKWVVVMAALVASSWAASMQHHSDATPRHVVPRSIFTQDFLTLFKNMKGDENVTFSRSGVSASGDAPYSISQRTENGKSVVTVTNIEDNNSTTFAVPEGSTVAVTNEGIFVTKDSQTHKTNYSLPGVPTSEKYNRQYSEPPTPSINKSPTSSPSTTPKPAPLSPSTTPKPAPLTPSTTPKSAPLNYRSQTHQFSTFQADRGKKQTSTPLPSRPTFPPGLDISKVFVPEIPSITIPKLPNVSIQKMPDISEYFLDLFQHLG